MKFKELKREWELTDAAIAGFSELVSNGKEPVSERESSAAVLGMVRFGLAALFSIASNLDTLAVCYRELVDIQKDLQKRRARE